MVSPRLFKKVLVANRGEIAVRIIRAIREMGMTPVAVYSDIDRDALHVRYAFEAYHIGPSSSQESYLNQERLIEVAKKAEVDAIHPGYGFLAENPEFARRCDDAGLIFIGPLPDTIEAMGDKIGARKTVEKAGIPVIPGSLRPVKDEKDLLIEARKVGFPIMLKASAGGGGKGMRLVHEEGEIPSSLQMARSEAEKAFGDDSIYVEKFLESPKHVEVQILADRFGNVYALGERDCSIQRRHQKLIEETPCSILKPEVRRRMFEVAIKVVQSTNYISAGTVEFLLDKDQNFYFLEMNTRLQVEHPVTEMVTGIDIVKAQIEIAMGLPLKIKENVIESMGHAMECRICAEDPYNDFSPSPGIIKVYRSPGGPWVRVDSGVYQGAKVPIFYDPLIAKVISWGQDRDECINRMKRALREFSIKGVKTTIPLFIRVMRNKTFLDGSYDTSFLTKEMSAMMDFQGKREDLALIMSAILKYNELKKEKFTLPEIESDGREKVSQWKIYGRLQGLYGKNFRQNPREGKL